MLGISCSDYIRGDRLLKTWAKHSDLITGDVNAQKCPKCKVNQIKLKNYLVN